MFLKMMTEHHQGAVAAALRELNDGSKPEVKQLAAKIVADQTTEVSRVQQLTG